jgi:pimeloyl-ACP methyl ester carboxylesterase
MSFPLEAPTGPPARQRLLFELLTPRETLRLPLRLPGLLRQRATKQSTILMVPGLGATDASLLPLRRFLRQLGHDARPINFGRISDDVEGQYLRVAEAIVQTSAEVNESVVLIGWSIGGVLVREAARDHPSLVKRVFTFGTPVVGGPKYSQVARQYPQSRIDAIAKRVDERARIPLAVPLTIMWSRFDGIVDPAACFDRVSTDAEHIEVNSTHLGMGLDPDVWNAIASRL